ncbi:uncharacterized protein LOC135367369 isoform X2 [Ornithodoros turicata]
MDCCTGIYGGKTDSKSLCDVYVLHRALQSWAPSTGSSPSSNIKCRALKMFGHWVVYFIYCDGKVLQCEAAEDPMSKQLYGDAKMVPFIDVEPFIKDMELVKKDADVPPERIREEVDKLNMGSSRYHFVTNNCQMWVKAVLKIADVKLNDMDLNQIPKVIGSATEFVFKSSRKCCSK